MSSQSKYRLAKQSKIIDALIEAANHGKEVTVFLELNARFDEENNINWSNKLEESLVNVMYGYEDFKIHAKAMLITMKIKGTPRYIFHVATGNYNEQTARQYTDANLFSSNEALAKDMVKFFQGISLSALQFESEHLLIAPDSLKSTFLKLIRDEVEFHSIYQNGQIIMKMNALSDKEIIQALYHAAEQGVKVQLIVRGICCVKARENLEIISILGRFLEHARLYYFHRRGEQQLYLASADMMTRNTQNRVELATPVLDHSCKRELLNYLEMQLNDPHAYHMDEHGNYHRQASDSDAADAQQQMLERTSLIISNKENPLRKALNWFQRKAK